MPHVIFLLICTIWGSSFILMKKATLAFTPLGVGAGRVAGGAVILALLWWLVRSRWSLRRGDLAAVLFVVVIGYAIPYCIQPLLIERHGSAFIAMTVSFLPLLTSAVSVPMLRCWPSRRQVVGMLGGLACMAALARDGLERNVPLADLLLAVSIPFSYALANVLIRRQLRHVAPLELSLVSLVLSTIVLLPLACGGGSSAVRRGDDFGLALASLAILGVVGTGIGSVLFNRLIRDEGPLFAGMVTYIVPVGGLAWGWWDHERVTALQLAALAGIFAMVAVVQYRPAPPPARHEA